ncbi:MAG: hypothetical protein NTX76_06040 [Alphaproteobacteria bacterium]|nr:hypothetical protein [Alphaproteobacteria bacterium]
MTIPKAYQTNRGTTSTPSKAWGKVAAKTHLVQFVMFFGISLGCIACGIRLVNCKENYATFDSGQFLKKIFPFRIGKSAHAAPEISPPKADTPPAVNKVPVVKEAENGPTKTKDPSFDPLALSSEGEVKLLQMLSNRRQDLDKREGELVKKELAIKTTESLIRNQMLSLAKVKEEVEQLLSIKDKEKKEHIAKLIKIYENMKPKEAARIFDHLDVRILKDIVQGMNQKKVSVVLGSMDVNKAKELSMLLATHRDPFDATATATTTPAKGK